MSTHPTPSTPGPRRLGNLPLLALLAACSSGSGVPEGYRNPTDADYAAVEGDPNVPFAPYEARADFDGDHQEDEAWLLMRRAGPGWGLFMVLGRDPSHPRALVEDAGGGAASMYLQAVPPGLYPTACGKGMGTCSPEEPHLLTLRLPGVALHSREGAASFFWWDVDTATFQRTWMSD